MGKPSSEWGSLGACRSRRVRPRQSPRPQPVNAPVDPRSVPQPGASPEGAQRGAVVTTSTRAPVAALTEAVLRGLRFIALTGEPGVSRSAVVDAFAVGLVEADVGIVRIRNSAPGPLGVSRLVALIVGGQYADAGHGVEDDLQRVVRVLTASIHGGRRLVLVIEDAETLDRAALAMLGLLPDLPREGSPCAQVLLVGRSGLWTLLADPPPAPIAKAAPALPPAEPEPSPIADSDNWPSLLSSFEPGARGRFRETFSRPALRRRLALLVVGVGLVSASFLAYHAFYRGLPFRPASLPQEIALQPAPAAVAKPQVSPSAPSPAPAGSTATEAQPSAGLTTLQGDTPKPTPSESPEKLRQDFYAFLVSQGGDMARLSEADRQQLFEQYYSRRLAR